MLRGLHDVLDGSGAEISKPEGGFFLWIRLPARTDLRKLSVLATAARVQYGYMKTDDCMLIELPMFHIGGVGSISGTLIAGCSAVLCESFSTERFWERVHRYGATTTSGLIGSMPAFLSKLPPSPDDQDNSLRFAVVARARAALQRARPPANNKLGR